MDNLAGHQLEEFRITTSPLILEQGVDSADNGLESMIDGMLRLVRELGRIDPAMRGNVQQILLQECEQFLLLQTQLSESLAHSAKLQSEMQARLGSIISSLKEALVEQHLSAPHALAEVQANSLSVVAAPPSRSTSVTEETGTALHVARQENAALTFSATCLRPFRIEIGNKPVELCSNRNGQAILRYLIAQPDHSGTADTFMDIFWPEDEAEVSARKLQVTMSILRRSLNMVSEQAPKEGYILYRQHAYQLNPAIPLHIDVDEFLWLYARGSRVEREAAIAYFEQACAIYVRPFLMEDLYADWSFLRREQLRQMHIHMCTILADHYLATRSYNKAAQWAATMIAENRCDEVAYRILMRAYALEGRRGEALRQFQRCEEVLLAELSMQPVPETVALYQAIAAGDLTSLS